MIGLHNPCQQTKTKIFEDHDKETGQNKVKLILRCLLIPVKKIWVVLPWHGPWPISVILMSEKKKKKFSQIENIMTNWLDSWTLNDCGFEYWLSGVWDTS